MKSSLNKYLIRVNVSIRLRNFLDWFHQLTAGKKEATKNLDDPN